MASVEKIMQVVAKGIVTTLVLGNALDFKTSVP